MLSVKIKSLAELELCKRGAVHSAVILFEDI